MAMAKIEFDPDRKIIENLFTGSLRMEVPRYQRSYSWTTKEAEDFYNDFILESEIAEDNLDFLGTILFTLDDNRGVLEVIDGQQRLLTITLFFAAMRDLLKFGINTNDSISYADEIQNNLIKTGSGRISAHGNELKEPFRLKVGRDLETFFAILAQNFVKDTRNLKAKSSAEKRAYETYMFFKSRVGETLDGPKSSDDKIKIIQRIITKILAISYIDIRVGNNETAYNLFESHNAKGQALAKTDLIKNYYFGRLKLPESQKIEKMDAWDSLLNNLDKETKGMWPDRFFSYMLQSYIGNFSSSYLYRRIKPLIDEPAKFSKKMDINVNAMILLKTSTTGDRLVDSSLEGINDYLKVNQCFIFLLALHRNRDKFTPSIYRKIIKAVENFSYVYSGVTSSPTNTLEKLYAKYATKLEEEATSVDKSDKIACERMSGRLLSEFKKEIGLLLPSEDRFIQDFVKLSYSNPRDRQLIRYTFQRIEECYSEDLIRLGFSFTLDHIIPQNTFGRQSKGNYHSIGNLVPLSQASNSRLGDMPPLQKLDSYRQNSQLHSAKILIEQLENGDFNADSIDQRAIILAKFAYKDAFSLA